MIHRLIVALLVVVAVGCAPASESRPVAAATADQAGSGTSEHRCPTPPTGDPAAHLEAVRLARENPSKAEIAALETHWTELWAIKARLGAEPVSQDWPRGCENWSVQSALVCRQIRIGARPKAPKPIATISCSVCFVDHLRFLSDVPRLERLHLGETYIGDLRSLSTLDRVLDLTLQNTNLRTFEPLATLTQLRRLRVRGIHLESLRGIEALKNLEALAIGGRCLGDLTPINTLTRLRELDIFFVPQADGPPTFDKLTELRKLWWRGSQLTSLNSIEALPHLEELRIIHHCVPESEIATYRASHPNVRFDVGRRGSECSR